MSLDIMQAFYALGQTRDIDPDQTKSYFTDQVNITWSAPIGYTMYRPDFMLRHLATVSGVAVWSVGVMSSRTEPSSSLTYRTGPPEWVSDL